MTDKAHAELLDDVLSRHEGSPDERLREITEAAIRHLHAFVEEVNLQRDERFAGIEFLTGSGRSATTAARSSSCCRTPSVCSTLVEMGLPGVDGSTENTVLGPFFVPSSPAGQGGHDARRPDEGDRVVIAGGSPTSRATPLPVPRSIAGRTPRTASTRSQQPDVQTAEENLPGHLHAPTTTGTYEIRTVRPVPYPIRPTGPSATCSRPTGGTGCGPGTPTCWCPGRRLQGPDLRLFDDTDHLARRRRVRGATALSAPSSPTPGERPPPSTSCWIASERSYSATTGLDRVPMPAMVTSTVSLGWSRIGGVWRRPTPPGVPVAITSPGLRCRRSTRRRSARRLSGSCR